MKPKRVAIYFRVSTSDQNPALQKDELTTYREFRKWLLVEAYSDTISGAKDKRPALDRLMADSRRSRFDVVAIWRFDRFARSTSHLLKALEEFQSLGIDFEKNRSVYSDSVRCQAGRVSKLAAWTYTPPNLMSFKK